MEAKGCRVFDWVEIGPMGTHAGTIGVDDGPGCEDHALEVAYEACAPHPAALFAVAEAGRAERRWQVYTTTLREHFGPLPDGFVERCWSENAEDVAGR